MKHKDYWQGVAALKCCVCQGDANIHHCLGGSMIDWFGGENSPRGTRNNHWLVIPLCHNHHQGVCGIHAMDSVREWEELYGSQVYHLVQTTSCFTSYHVWDKAGYPDPTPYGGPESYQFGVKSDEYREMMRAAR
jgi:hypothetical protein